MTRDGLPKRVREFIRGHPDTSPAAVLGRFDELDADDLNVIAEALGAATPEIDTESEPINEQHVSGENDAPEGGSPASHPTPEDRKADSSSADVDEWSAVAFDDPEPATWSPDWGERERWMGRIPEDKHSFAPWGDADAPAPCTKDDHDAETAAECGCDARYKWGYRANYADLETAREWSEMHPRLDGVTFQLVESDDEPFAFVDGDDVRDPETKEVHPAFVDLLDRLAAMSRTGGWR